MSNFKYIRVAAEFVPAVEALISGAKAETRDQKAAGTKAHKASVVPDIALATAVVALANWTKQQSDKGEFIYAKNSGRFVHHGYARIVRVHGKTDSDTVEISTTVCTKRDTHTMIYQKPWAEWRALWMKYNEKYFKQTAKHTVVPVHQTF